MDIISRVIHKLLSYGNSHRYDLVAICCGTIIFCVIWVLKKRLKEINAEKTETVAQYRRHNLVIPLISILLGIPLYAIASTVLPLVHLTVKPLIYSVLFPMGIYAIYEAWKSDIRGKIASLLLLIAVFILDFFASGSIGHFKMCYALKAYIQLMAVLGILCQFICFKEE